MTVARLNRHSDGDALRLKQYAGGSIETIGMTIVYVTDLSIKDQVNKVFGSIDILANNAATKTNNLKKKGQINLSKNDINNLYKFELKRIFWTEKLIALSKITPNDMAVTKLEFKGKKLFISVSAIFFVIFKASLFEKMLNC